ncbi:MAG: hypothetical protein R2726_03670 [Acidimicrobiales bacterium]
MTSRSGPSTSATACSTAPIATWCSATGARTSTGRFALDLDVVFPIDRLEELAAEGTIGAVAPRHLAFAGNQDDSVAKVRLDTAPRAAALLAADGVDVVLLTPV